jgi:hypothetical protein
MEAMSDLHVIESTLTRTAQRRRLERGFRQGCQGMFWGAVAWVLLLGAYKLLPLPRELAVYAWLAAPLGALIGFVWGWSRPTSLAQTARWVDGQKRLQERLSTALEVVKSEREDAAWKSLIVSDAARAAADLNPKELLPLRFPRIARWAVLLVVLGVGLGFVPEYRSKTFVQAQKNAEAIQQTGRELASLTRRNLAARPPAIETTKKTLEEIQDLGEHMSKAQLTRGEALKNLANVTEKLKEQTRELANNPALRNLERAARSSSSKGGSPSSDLQQKLESMAKSGVDSANPEALEKMKEALEKAQQMAASLPKGDSPEAKDAQEKLSAALADLAKQAKNLGLDLPSLSEAIASLQNLEPDQVLKDLQFAELELEKMEAMAKALEKMQIDAQKLGKDLAEQLKQGQAEAAEATLRKMEQALKQGRMTPEEFQKMMQEVGDALNPAKNYGEVGDHLAKAMQQMQAGDKAEAGEALGAAAAALAKMAGELGDAQSLLATLEALQAAQMCLANGQGYNPGGAGGKSGAPKGKKGRGFGTWHDENSWEYPEMSESWDNSGLEQREMDGRGISDRGDGQMADSLAPTKIKGQITPGGPMPSITMKGVSIKGNSKVEIQEMAAAAQSDAQSALNQDQVPRAYQNAVRNYFDDLKE